MDKVWEILNKISIIVTIISFVIGFFLGKTYEIHKNSVKKIFMFFSSHNNITQVDNHIHLSNLLSEKICLDTIKEKWNNTEFLGATELLNNLIKETKNDQSQVNFLLLKASLYFSIESWDITNELLQYIEKNYPKEIKDCYEYFELKFLLNPPFVSTDRMYY